MIFMCKNPLPVPTARVLAQVAINCTAVDPLFRTGAVSGWIDVVHLGQGEQQMCSDLLRNVCLHDEGDC